MTTSFAPTEATTFNADNPFAERSTLPFGAPPLDRIRDDDFTPAIEEGMRRQLEEVKAIADREDSPTFDNTIVALERSGELLTRVLKTFGAVTSANRRTRHPSWRPTATRFCSTRRFFAECGPSMSDGKNSR